MELAGSTSETAERRRPPRERLRGVRRVYDDKAYLYQIIETIGSGPDLSAILRGIVRLVTEATRCHACFIYFREDEHLELRAASSMYVHLEGEVALQVGEGLTGWVAKTRRSAVIKESALEDPRVRCFPELEDEQFQSLVSVPIFSRAGDVIGVITLHAVAPHEFGRADLDFLEHTAALVGGAVENARMYEEATVRVALLTELSLLARRIASAASVDELLATVAAGCRELIDAEHCEIYLLDPDRRPLLRAASPERAGAPPLDAVSLWLDEVGVGKRRGLVGGTSDEKAFALALWGSGASGVPMVVPLVVGDERLGVLCALAERPAPGASSALAATASHTAVAIKQHQLIDWLKEKNLVKDFFEALSRGDVSSDELEAQARRLGCSLGEPHVLLHAVPWGLAAPASGRRGKGQRSSARDPDWQEFVSKMESRLAAEIPGSVFDRRQSSMRGLLPVKVDAAESAAALVREVHCQLAGGDPHVLAIGLSNVCQGTESYSRGFEEAVAAAQVGALIRGGAGIFTYEELGPYRYALMSDETVRDRYQERIERLADYERRRGTELLGTLETYLDCRGNVVRTSRLLFIHPNTLRQRLARIERVAELDLEREEWLSLAIAIKVVKLRQMKKQAQEEGREGRE